MLVCPLMVASKANPMVMRMPPVTRKIFHRPNLVMSPPETVAKISEPPTIGSVNSPAIVGE